MNIELRDLGGLVSRSQVEKDLDQLQQRYPLPENVSNFNFSLRHKSIGSRSCYSLGVRVNLGQEPILAGAADIDTPPVLRAYMELQERISLQMGRWGEDEEVTLLNSEGKQAGNMQASDVFETTPDPERWQGVGSNGMACHSSFKQAATAGRKELIERERLLRSWYGEWNPELISEPPGEVPDFFSAADGEYDFTLFSLDPPLASSREINVTGIFGFPREDSSWNFTLGFGAGFTRQEAFSKAAVEMLQSVMQIRDDYDSSPEDKHRDPEDVEVDTTTDYHTRYYHTKKGMERLRRWVTEGHPDVIQDRFDPLNEQELTYVDMTPNDLQGNLWIVKALAPGGVPLYFGRGHPDIPEMPDYMKVHPLP